MLKHWTPPASSSHFSPRKSHAFRKQAPQPDKNIVIFPHRFLVTFRYHTKLDGTPKSISSLPRHTWRPSVFSSWATKREAESTCWTGALLGSIFLWWKRIQILGTVFLKRTTSRDAPTSWSWQASNWARPWQTLQTAFEVFHKLKADWKECFVPQSCLALLSPHLSIVRKTRTYRSHSNVRNHANFMLWWLKRLVWFYQHSIWLRNKAQCLHEPCKNATCTGDIVCVCVSCKRSPSKHRSSACHVFII